MSLILEIHLILAFLVVFCALIFSWNSMGRRVMNAVVGLQVLVGLIVAGLMGAALGPQMASVGVHLLCGVGALVAYIFARRLGDRPGGARTGMMLGALGLVLILSGFYLGLHMVGKV